MQHRAALKIPHFRPAAAWHGKCFGGGQRARQPAGLEERNTTMTKPTQTLGTNVNVLDEAQLEQVVGGHGRCGGYRKNYGHGYKNRRNDCYNYDGGYESKSYDDSYDGYDSDSSYDDNDKYGCERKYS
jgi:hypothetical protein